MKTHQLLSRIFFLLLLCFSKLLFAQIHPVKRLAIEFDSLENNSTRSYLLVHEKLLNNDSSTIDNQGHQLFLKQTLMLSPGNTYHIHLKAADCNIEAFMEHNQLAYRFVDWNPTEEQSWKEAYLKVQFSEASGNKIVLAAEVHHGMLFNIGFERN